MKSTSATTAAAAAALVAVAVATAGPHTSGTMRTPAASSCTAHSIGRVGPTQLTYNRWVSKALTLRGGADESGSAAETADTGADQADEMEGVLSPAEVAVTSFRDIVGDKLLIFENPKKGKAKEVR